MDELDNKKELVVRSVGAGESGCIDITVYEIEKDGLRLLTTFGEDWEIESINGKYFFLHVLDGIVEDKYSYSRGLILGYYLYEDGEFKFIDRFLNGEKICDEYGNFSKNFREAIFTLHGYWGENVSLFNVDTKAILGNSKIKFVRMNKEIAEDGSEIYSFEVEAVENVILGPYEGYENNIAIPSGYRFKMYKTRPEGEVFAVPF